MEKFTGLTIAKINKDKKSDCFKNYMKFGNKYWDDGKECKSQIGFHFIYYYQNQFVYVHKIINILPHSQRPDEMKQLTKGNNILILSERLKTFTWREWISGIGMNAPYTSPTSCQAPTCARTPSDLSSRFIGFDYKKLESIQLKKNDHEEEHQEDDEEDEEEDDDDDDEEEDAEEDDDEEEEDETTKKLIQILVNKQKKHEDIIKHHELELSRIKDKIKQLS